MWQKCCKWEAQHSTTHTLCVSRYDCAEVVARIFTKWYFWLTLVHMCDLFALFAIALIFIDGKQTNKQTEEKNYYISRITNRRTNTLTKAGNKMESLIYCIASWSLRIASKSCLSLNGWQCCKCLLLSSPFRILRGCLLNRYLRIGCKQSQRPPCFANYGP